MRRMEGSLEDGLLLRDAGIGPGVDPARCDAHEMLKHQANRISGDGRHNQRKERAGDDRIRRIACRQPDRDRKGEGDEGEGTGN
jgi:hypothetical protein